MLDFIRRVGWRTVSNVHQLGGIANFGARMVYETFRPPWRLRRVVDEIYITGVLSLVIVLLSGAVVGAVLGLQGYITLSRFGAENSLGGVVGLGQRDQDPIFDAELRAQKEIPGRRFAAGFGIAVAPL